MRGVDGEGERGACVMAQCIEAGCTNAVERNARGRHRKRCRVHVNPRNRFRNNPQWKRARKAVLAKDPVCMCPGRGKCAPSLGRPCCRPSTTADHVIPFSELLRTGATHLFYALSNLRGSCASCNYSRGDGSRGCRGTREPDPVDSVVAEWFGVEEEECA